MTNAKSVRYLTALVGLIAIVTSSAMAALVDPIGLNNGDKYHIVFATSTAIDATSSDIADYNAFVNSVAGAAGSWVKDIATTWKAIASTRTVNANANAPITAPVFRVDGVKVADSYGDMWDGSLDAVINVTETGGAPTDWIWTGSNTSGSQFIQPTGVDAGKSLALGTDQHTKSTTGALTASSTWVTANAIDQSSEFSVYAISGELTFVVPEPAALQLLAVGVMLVVMRRR